MSSEEFNHFSSFPEGHSAENMRTNLESKVQLSRAKKLRSIPTRVATLVPSGVTFSSRLQSTFLHSSFSSFEGSAVARWISLLSASLSFARSDPCTLILFRTFISSQHYPWQAGRRRKTYSSGQRRDLGCEHCGWEGALLISNPGGKRATAEGGEAFFKTRGGVKFTNAEQETLHLRK